MNGQVDFGTSGNPNEWPGHLKRFAFFTERETFMLGPVSASGTNLPAVAQGGESAPPLSSPPADARFESP